MCQGHGGLGVIAEIPQAVGRRQTHRLQHLMPGLCGLPAKPGSAIAQRNLLKHAEGLQQGHATGRRRSRRQHVHLPVMANQWRAQTRLVCREVVPDHAASTARAGALDFLRGHDGIGECSAVKRRRLGCQQAQGAREIRLHQPLACLQGPSARHEDRACREVHARLQSRFSKHPAQIGRDAEPGFCQTDGIGEIAGEGQATPALVCQPEGGKGARNPHRQPAHGGLLKT